MPNMMHHCVFNWYYVCSFPEKCTKMGHQVHLQRLTFLTNRKLYLSSACRIFWQDQRDVDASDNSKSSNTYYSF